MSERTNDFVCDRGCGPAFVTEVGARCETLCRRCYLGYDYIIKIDPDTEQYYPVELRPDPVLVGKRCQMVYVTTAGDMAHVRTLDGPIVKVGRRFVHRIKSNTSA